MKYTKSFTLNQKYPHLGPGRLGQLQKGHIMHHGPMTFNALPPFLRRLQTDMEQEPEEDPDNTDTEGAKKDPLQQLTNTFKEDLDLVLGELPDQPYTPRDQRSLKTRRTARSDSLIGLILDQIRNQPRDWIHRVTVLFNERQARRNRGKKTKDEGNHPSRLGNVRAANRRAPPPEMVPW